MSGIFLYKYNCLNRLVSQASQGVILSFTDTISLASLPAIYYPSHHGMIISVFTGSARDLNFWSVKSRILQTHLCIQGYFHLSVQIGIINWPEIK